MKKYRRFFALILTLVLTLTMTPGNLPAAEFESGDAAEVEEFAEEVLQEEAEEDVFFEENLPDREADLPDAAESFGGTDLPDAAESFDGTDLSDGTDLFEDGEEPLFGSGEDAEEAFGDGNKPQVKFAEMTYVNPLYADVIEETDLEQLESAGSSTASETVICDSLEAAGAEMRKHLKNRETTIELQFKTSDSDYSTIMKAISTEAMKHTGDPTEGDYLKWQYGGWKGKISGYPQQDGAYIYTFSYTMTYYTTAEQEAAVDTKLSEVMNGLALSGKSRYEQVKAIYDYICSHTKYDNANLNDESYKLKYTAYAALLNGTSVCQGYAVLFYRMALEAGIDARVITGMGNGGGHAWNIAELQSKYYNLDSTWDASRKQVGYGYGYFLKCDGDFGDHIRDSGAWGENFTSAEFYAAYPMGESNYIPETCTNHDWRFSKVLIAPTCTEKGEGLYECTVCQATTTKDLSALGHTEVKDAAVEPTCTEAGKTEGSHCAACNAIFEEQKPISAKGHQWSAWKAVSEATALTAAKQNRTCSRCRKTETQTKGSPLKRTMTVPTTFLPMTVKQSVTNFKVTGMAKGDYVVSWKSNKTSVVKVSGVKPNGTGKITAQKKTGDAEIIITLKSGLTKTIKVKVQKSKVTTSKVSGIAKKASIQKGRKLTLSPVITPISSKEKVTYTSSNKKVATVSASGVVKGIKPGTAVITVKSGKRKAVCKVTVTGIKAAAIKNVKSKISLKKGKSSTLKPKLVPAGSTDKVTYKSSNKKIVSVSSKGKITAKKKGNAVITIKAGSVSVKCRVTVK